MDKKYTILLLVIVVISFLALYDWHLALNTQRQQGGHWNDPMLRKPTPYESKTESYMPSNDFPETSGTPTPEAQPTNTSSFVPVNGKIISYRVNGRDILIPSNFKISFSKSSINFNTCNNPVGEYIVEKETIKVPTGFLMTKKRCIGPDEALEQSLTDGFSNGFNILFIEPRKKIRFTSVDGTQELIFNTVL